MAGKRQKEAEEVKPWEQQKHEHSKVYSLFISYRDMGPTRSLVKLAKLLGKHSLNHFYKYSILHGWQERVRAWDQHLQSIEDRAIEDGRREMGKRQAKLGNAMQAIVAKAIEQQILDDKGKLLVKIAPSVLAKLADIGVKVERLGRGEPTETIANEINGGVSIFRFPVRAKSAEEWAASAKEGNGGCE